MTKLQDELVKNPHILEDPLQGAARDLGLLLHEHGKTIAVVESLTAGRLQAALGATSGASSYFQGGLCTYNLHQKVRFLDIDRDHAASCDCVSQRVGREMAVGAQALFEADIILSTTGYAEPVPSKGIDKPMAIITCLIGRTARAVTVKDSENLNRTQFQQKVTLIAIEGLIKVLMGDTFFGS